MVLSPTHTVHHAPHEPPPPTDFDPNLNEISQAVERRMRLRELEEVPGEESNFECEMIPDAEMSLRAIAAAGYEVVLVAVSVPWVSRMAVRVLQERGILGSQGLEPIHTGNVLFCLEPTEKKLVLQKMGGFVLAVDRNFNVCESIMESNPQVHAVLFNPDQPNESAMLQDLRVAQADAYALHELVQQYGARQVERVKDPSNPAHTNELQRLAPLIHQLHTRVATVRSLVPAHRLPPNSAAVMPAADAETHDRPWLQVCDLLHVPRALVSQFETSAGSKRVTSKNMDLMYPLAASNDEATLARLRAGEIPDGWEPMQDKATGQWFFINHKAKTSSWLQPVHAADDIAAAAWMQRSRRNEEHMLGDVGIGLTLAKDAAGKMRVVALQDGGPAQKSGRVQIDDVVLSIDGVELAQASEEQAMARLNGAPGTPVVLRLQQGSDIDELANKISWVDLVTKSAPDPQAANEDTFIVNGMRLTVPEEDDQGIFTVRDVETQALVYRGPGKYKGVWDILCVEGKQVQGRPEIFTWRGEEFYQPSYDARGIATVKKALTDEVVYRGPGDSYVPGHPGNSSVATPFVWMVRGHPRAKRGRVMVDLARVVLRLVPKGQQQAPLPQQQHAAAPAAPAAPAADSRVGCTVQMDCDFNTAMVHKGVVMKQLRRDLAAALDVPVERFSTALPEPGSLMLKFNIVPAAMGAGPPAKALGDAIVAQARDSSSALRQQPLTSNAVNASVHRALDPAPPCMSPEQEVAMEQAVVGDEISQQGLAHISIYIMSARSLPRAQAQRLPDAFVSATLDGHTASTTCVRASINPTFRSHIRLPLRAGVSPDATVRVCVYDMSGALMGGQPLGELSYSLRGLRANYEANEVNDGVFELHGAAGMGTVVQGADGAHSALQIRIEYVAAGHSSNPVAAAAAAAAAPPHPSPGPSVAMPAKAQGQSSPVAPPDPPPAAGGAGAQRVLVDVFDLRSLPQV